ncbi:baculoviral IAP repeat-containing protein 2 [Patella vulgata]|uniref:baculoviral IAP repeat-containing protein 2 n=1 Tax=Patella vulgata TaxID=6465 RepID=UPI00218081EE|nr:baculoviral IAP repeat-containing protein 2 [Patella vulgata]XP_050392208.1 baculoviral IAP repeat-containing protein 2 [Patella vulgata]XP_050392209.1 baculoviral IAP repeat-containing protein 2 [Patella vulgata]
MMSHSSYLLWNVLLVTVLFLFVPLVNMQLAATHNYSWCSLKKADVEFISRTEHGWLRFLQLILVIQLILVNVLQTYSNETNNRHTENKKGVPEENQELMYKGVSSIGNNFYEINQTTRLKERDDHENNPLMSKCVSLTIDNYYEATLFQRVPWDVSFHQTITAYPFLPQYQKDFDSNCMRYEGIRLASYNHTAFYFKISCLELAKEGFYSSGRNDEAICFECGMTKSSWFKGVRPKQIHQNESPSCLFYTPFSRNVKIRNQEKPTKFAQPKMPDGSRNKTHEDPHLNETTTKLASTYITNENMQEDTILKEESSKEAAGNMNWERSNQPNNFIDHSMPAEIEYVNGILNKEGSKSPQYESLISRISTFTKAWKNTGFQSPIKMAEAGFFYTGNVDAVKCWFCGIALKTWEPTDDPWMEHIRWSNNCGFIKSQKGADFVIELHNNMGQQTTMSSQRNNTDLTESVAVAMNAGFTNGQIDEAVTIVGPDAPIDLLMDVLMNINMNTQQDS